MADVTVRVAEAGDTAALATLRALWSEGSDPDFEARMAGWIAAEGERRTTWLATTAAAPAGYVRLVLSPSERAVPFYRRAGFVVPDDAVEDHRLLVRPAR